MIRIKIVKPHKQYSVGETITVSRNEAFGLLDAGYAVMSKDMTVIDYKTKFNKRKPKK